MLQLFLICQNLFLPCKKHNELSCSYVIRGISNLILCESAKKLRLVISEYHSCNYSRQAIHQYISTRINLHQTVHTYPLLDHSTQLSVILSCQRGFLHLYSKNPCRYKYKYLRATTANIPNDILKDNRGSKLTVDANGLLKVQHIINIRPAGGHQQDNITEGAAIRTSYIEFYLAPEEEVDHEEGFGEDQAQYS